MSPFLDPSLPVFPLALVGLIVGFVAGMFGVGGGFLLTPILLYGFHIAPAVAVGSSLCQQIGTSLTAFLRYRRQKLGEPKIDLLLLGGSLVGVDAGGRVLRWLSALAPLHLRSGKTASLAGLIVNGLFTVLLFWIAGFVFAETRRTDRGAGPKRVPFLASLQVPPCVSLPSAGVASTSALALAYLGLVLGFLSGVMGVGGGVLLLPVLLYGYGLPARTAAGTGILVLFATVSWGTWRAASVGNVSLPLAMALLTGSSIGALLGARTTARLSNRTLRVCFAGLVFATALAVAANLLRTLLGK